MYSWKITLEWNPKAKFLNGKVQLHFAFWMKVKIKVFVAKYMNNRPRRLPFVNEDFTRLSLFDVILWKETSFCKGVSFMRNDIINWLYYNISSISFFIYFNCLKSSCLNTYWSKYYDVEILMQEKNIWMLLNFLCSFQICQYIEHFVQRKSL